MKLVNKLSNYLLDSDYKITLKNNNININNYDEIIDFSLTKISVKCKNNIIIIEGRNLRITTMIDNEVLIKGYINKISIN